VDLEGLVGEGRAADHRAGAPTARQVGQGGGVMQNVPGTGKRLTPAELAAVLRDAADEVERTASIEGSIAWETPDENFDNRFEVIAFYRVGNDAGQGGAVVIRDFNTPSDATNQEH
jgi:hypothetical protein